MKKEGPTEYTENTEKRYKDKKTKSFCVFLCVRMMWFFKTLRRNK